MRDVVDATAWDHFGGLHDAFMQACAERFAFLRADYGFALAGKFETRTSAEVRYANQTTGVIVAWDASDHSLSAYIAREDGIAMRWQEVSHLTPRSDPHLPRAGAVATIWDESTMLAAIATHAETLRRHGDAVLRGDFAVLLGALSRDVTEAPEEA